MRAPSERVTVIGVGAPGGVAAFGVAATNQGSAVGAGRLAPWALTARILTRYSAPLVNPSRVKEVVPAPLSATAVHLLQATPA